jgi:hypothetical protein
MSRQELVRIVVHAGTIAVAGLLVACGGGSDGSPPHTSML